MMAPLPTPTAAADRPDLPRVRLEVRTASGRPVSYEVGADEFLIGGSAGCDLRLPTPNLPPIICQITLKADGVRVRRIATSLPVSLNGAPLPATSASPIANGDVLSLAGMEITVEVQQQHPAVVVPHFVSLDPDAAAVTPPGDLQAGYRELEAARKQFEAEEAARREEWARRDNELIRRARELDRQTEELESDRVIWYQRRQQIVSELERHEASGGSQAALEARERELDALKHELTAFREQLVKEYQEKRDELARQQDEATRHRDAAGLLHQEPRIAELRERQERLAAAEADLARRNNLLATDREIFERTRATFEAHTAAETERLMTWENTLVDRDAERARQTEELQTERAALDRDRLQFQEDLVRLERRTAAIEEKEHAIAERAREADVRLEQLKRDAAEWEETVRSAAAEGDRLRAEAERLDRQKAELDAQSAVLAGRAGELESQQAVIAVQRAKLDRIRQDAEREAAQLAAARQREDEALAELRTRIREAEELRAELASVHETAALERQRLEERDSLLAGGLTEIDQQREALAAESERLRLKEAELDQRAAEFAEQAGTLKGRITQALDLQARLEADRVAIREREAALAQAEEARQALQEQLRRRAEDLTARARALDEMARQVAADRAAVEHVQTAAESTRLTVDDEVLERVRQLEERAAVVDRLAADCHQKDQAIARQATKLKEVGMAVAAERKALAEARAQWEAERTARLEADARTRAELEEFRATAAAEIAALREQAPELEDQTRAALDRISTARDVLRGHLTELNDFARMSRDDLNGIREQIRQEAERLREQEESVNRARAEHRLAVSAFRQQLIEWQGQVAEMKRSLTHSESRLDARQAAVDQAAKDMDATTQQLAAQAEQLRRERDAVAVRRAEMERHLADMREWYRKKLRELAASSGERQAVLSLHDASPPAPADAAEEPDPGDKQLGELLQTHGLIDAETLRSLWAEASRQRRTLRQVLLASGVITLYQLALIEAGNLDALVLGRFRVIDRLRATPREAIYRVFDPTRGAGRVPGAPDGVFLLRHLAEAEMQDAVRPDEFRQRFAAARDAAHLNLVNVTEVLELNGRPAVVQEWPTGLYSADWPAFAAHPGCWVRLVAMAAAGIESAHRHGIVHGRLTADSFVLTPGGVVKVAGFGEPPWLSVAQASSTEPTAAFDLRSFGQVIYFWSQLAAKRKGGARPKPFPEPLLAIIRRLEADPEPPMADTVATGQPYDSAAELVADLDRVARTTPFSDDAWEKLLRHVGENAPDAPVGLKRSA